MYQKIAITIFIFLFLSANVFCQQQKGLELASINFTGNNSFSSTKLLEIIVSKQSPSWIWQFLNSFTSFGKGPEYFDSASIGLDLLSLHDFYKANGYFNAQITSSYKIDTSKSKVSLLYTIKEGNSYTYGVLNFIGLRRVRPEIVNELYGKLNFNPKARYSEENIHVNVNNALSVLKNEGYMLASFDSSVAIMDSSDFKVNLYIYIRTGMQYKFSKINIEKSGNGSDLVSDKLLREITAINPGDFYDQEKIQISQYRLARTGLFNTVLLNPTIADTSNNTVPLSLSGNIGDLNEMAPEIVMDNQREAFNLGLGANFVKKNLFGDARVLTLNVKGEILDIFHFNYNDFFRSHSARDSTFQGTFESSLLLQQPYLFKRPITTSLELYIQSITQNMSIINTYGSKLSLDFEMPYYTFISLLKPYFIFEYVQYSPNLNNPNITLKSNSTTSIIGTQFGSAKSNNIMFPTKGDNLSFIIEGASSVTNFHANEFLSQSNSYNNIDETQRALFYKLQGTSAFYLPISNDDNATLAIKFETGFIQTISGGYNVIPPNQTFFAGGSNSIRGWRGRELVPHDSIKYFGVTLTDSLRGGTFLLDGSFEFRRKFMPKFGIVFFTDYGNTWNGYRTFRFNQVAIAAGFGFRYYSQIAPFRVDFGFKCYDPADKRTIFKKSVFKQMEIHFGIGEAF